MQTQGGTESLGEEGRPREKEARNQREGRAKNSERKKDRKLDKEQQKPQERGGTEALIRWAKDQEGRDIQTRPREVGETSV